LKDIDELKIEIDEEMWYSMTPEGVGKSHARSVKRAFDCGLFLDAFCGYGTDMIYQSRTITTIGCDISEARLHAAKRLHARLGRSHSDYILADSVNGKSCFRRAPIFDVVYLSPPWGHRGIRNRHQQTIFGTRRLNQLLVDGTIAFKRALSIVRNFNISYYLPRGISESDIVRLAMLTRSSQLVFAHAHAAFDPDDETVSSDEEKYKVRGLTIYFGNLAKQFIS